eukprot:scaffold1402_cov254-Pinguiococcus_pyrenoidosus.AAC.44
MAHHVLRLLLLLLLLPPAAAVCLGGSLRAGNAVNGAVPSYGRRGCLGLRPANSFHEHTRLQAMKTDSEEDSRLSADVGSELRKRAARVFLQVGMAWHAS